MNKGFTFAIRKTDNFFDRKSKEKEKKIFFFDLLVS